MNEYIEPEEIDNLDIWGLELEKDLNKEEEVVYLSKYDAVNYISFLKMYSLNRINLVYSQYLLKLLNQLEKKLYEEPRYVQSKLDNFFFKL